MGTITSSSHGLVFYLTDLQHALWQLDVPILNKRAVAKHKNRAKLRILWQQIRWLLLGMTALLAFECLGRDWLRATFVGVAAFILAILFSWLVSVYDLQWSTLDYASYRSLHPVPA